jgi:Uma2 family endonuclease
VERGETTTGGLLGRNPWVARRLITVADYHRMGEAGILSGADRVELVEGELVAMSPVGSPHAGAVNALNRLLVGAVGARGVVSVQNPVRLDDRTEPQPDVAVLRPRADDYRVATPGPGDVLLLVEVADSSLGYDRAVKAPLYAAHGIPELWIVDLAAREVEVHKTPEVGRYASVARVRPGGSLDPEFLSGVSIPAAAVLG